MAEQRRIGYRWHLRTLMAQRNLWKSTELMPLLRARGINLSESQIYRLVTGTPERIPARTFAALCDILDCTPGDLFEPVLEMRAAATAEAPARSEDLGVTPGQPIARRIRLVDPESPASGNGPPGKTSADE
jgi:DNA-binding Xre family transcriptional regulator